MKKQQGFFGNLFASVASAVDDLFYWIGCRLQDFFDSKFFTRIDNTYMRVPMPGYRDIKFAEVLFYFGRGIAGGKVWQRAKGLSYSLLMALPPMLVFLFTLVAYLPIDGVQDEILGQLEGIIPDNFYQKISDTVNDVMGHKHSSLMSIGFIVSVFLAANGIYGCYRSINNNPDVEHKPFLPVYGGSIVMVFLLFVLLIAAMALLVGYKLLLGLMISRNIIAHTKFSMVVFGFGRWVILTLLTLFVINAVYRFVMVDKRQNKLLRFFSVGSVLSTILFFLLTWLIQIYLNYFNRFNLLYGSIGTILMIMLWLFANCYVLLVGYEVNISVIKSAKDPNLWREMRWETRMKRRARRLREDAIGAVSEPQEPKEEVPEEAPQPIVVEPSEAMTIRLTHEPDGWKAVVEQLDEK